MHQNTQPPFSHHHRQGTPADMPGTHAIHSTETTRPPGKTKAAGGQRGKSGRKRGRVRTSRGGGGTQRQMGKKKRKRGKCLTGTVSGASCCAGVRLRAWCKFSPDNCACTAQVVSEGRWRTPQASVRSRGREYKCHQKRVGGACLTVVLGVSRIPRYAGTLASCASLFQPTRKFVAAKAACGQTACLRKRWCSWPLLSTPYSCPWHMPMLSAFYPGSNPNLSRSVGRQPQCLV